MAAYSIPSVGLRHLGSFRSLGCCIVWRTNTFPTTLSDVWRFSRLLEPANGLLQVRHAEIVAVAVPYSDIALCLFLCTYHEYERNALERLVRIL